MTILFSNNASTTVAGSITPTDTTVNIAPGTGIEFPNPITPGDFFVATFYDQATKTINEIVHVTHRATDTCTIVRGQEGTTPKAWNSGDIFANLITAGTLASFNQSAAPAASTTDVYTGIDTSTNINLIVANTSPIPASFQIGMVFVIKMLNQKFPPVTSPGPPPVLGSIFMQLNGGSGIAVKRTDGSDFGGGELVGGEEYLFVYNGSHFTSAIMNIPQRPPQTIFYVNGTYGNDYNSGLSDNGTVTTQAFKTPQGAIDRIKERYISSVQITVRVADGTYIGGFKDDQNYIASWLFQGNTANPQNCIIDATSTNLADFAANAAKGTCIAAQHAANITAIGFTLKSRFYNFLAYDGGRLYSTGNLNFTASLNGFPVIFAQTNGTIQLEGNFQYSGGTVVNSVISGNNGGVVVCGRGSIYGNFPFHLTINGATSAGSFCNASLGGICAFDNPVVSFSGAVTGPDYLCTTAGGIVFQGATTILPGTAPGIVSAPGWVAG